MGFGQNVFDTWTPGALAVLRLVTGCLYLQHGTACIGRRGPGPRLLGVHMELLNQVEQTHRIAEPEALELVDAGFAI